MAIFQTLRPFIVHGHDYGFRDEVITHMRGTHQMLDPVVLDGVAGAGRTLIEKFEEESAKCHLAVVLMTPDDKAKTSTGLVYGTARPNVWLELGYFLATFGRKTGRTLLIYRKGLDIPTDLTGLEYIDATAGISDVNVAKRLATQLNYIVSSGFAPPAASPVSSSGNFDVTGRIRLVGR